MLALALLLLVPDDTARHAALMDEIEARVKLPADAHPLTDYGRHYAFHGRHQVWARFMLPEPPYELSNGCYVSQVHGSHRCTEAEIAKERRDSEESIAYIKPKGGRRWYKNERALPFMFDGGCAQVTILYDIDTKRFLYVACNGFA